MSDPTRSTTPAETTLTVIESEESIQQDVPTVRVKLRKPKAQKKVQWGSETVDNENLNKKKSKCCCQYQKPTAFGESSSESDDECEHCSGHVEKKKLKSGVTPITECKLPEKSS